MNLSGCVAVCVAVLSALAGRSVSAPIDSRLLTSLQPDFIGETRYTSVINTVVSEDKDTSTAPQSIVTISSQLGVSASIQDRPSPDILPSLTDNIDYSSTQKELTSSDAAEATTATYTDSSTSEMSTEIIHSRARRDLSIPALQNAMNNLPHRAICQWVYSLNVDPNRIPDTLPEASCNSTAPGLTGNVCETVLYYVPVQRRIDSTTWTPGLQLLKVGCTLAQPITSFQQGSTN